MDADAWGVGQPASGWVKASASSAINACVEMAPVPDAVLVRDSKDPGSALRFTPLEIAAWLDGAKRGEFDHLVPDEVRAQLRV